MKEAIVQDGLERQPTLLDKARTKTLEGLTLDHKEVLVTGVFVSRIDPLEC